MGKRLPDWEHGFPAVATAPGSVRHVLKRREDINQLIISCKHVISESMYVNAYSEVMGVRVERNVCVNCGSVVLAVGAAWEGPPLRPPAFPGDAS